MALSRISNGNLSDASQLDQFIDLLTGVMTDQPVTLSNTFEFSGTAHTISGATYTLPTSYNIYEEQLSTNNTVITLRSPANAGDYLVLTVYQGSTGGFSYSLLGAGGGTPTYASGVLPSISTAGGAYDSFLCVPNYAASDWVIFPSGQQIQGGGLPPSAHLTGQTAAVSSIVSVTSANDGAKHFYRIDFAVNVTAIGSGSFKAQVTMTDDNGASKTMTAQVTPNTGTAATSITTTDDWSGSIVVSANPNTAVTALTSGTFTSTTYNVAAAITQLG